MLSWKLCRGTAPALALCSSGQHWQGGGKDGTHPTATLRYSQPPHNHPITTPQLPTTTLQPSTATPQPPYSYASHPTATPSHPTAIHSHPQLPTATPQPPYSQSQPPTATPEPGLDQSTHGPSGQQGRAQNWMLRGSVRTRTGMNQGSPGPEQDQAGNQPRVISG